MPPLKSSKAPAREHFMLMWWLRSPAHRNLQRTKKNGAAWKVDTPRGPQGKIGLYELHLGLAHLDLYLFEHSSEGISLPFAVGFIDRRPGIDSRVGRVIQRKDVGVSLTDVALSNLLAIDK